MMKDATIRSKLIGKEIFSVIINKDRNKIIIVLDDATVLTFMNSEQYQTQMWIDEEGVM